MTKILTNTRNKLTSAIALGLNVSSTKPIIGIVSYTSTTGNLKQCEVTASFWGNKPTPDSVDCVHFLFDKGYGLIRFNTIKYSSLI